MNAPNATNNALNTTDVLLDDITIFTISVNVCALVAFPFIVWVSCFRKASRRCLDRLHGEDFQGGNPITRLISLILSCIQYVTHKTLDEGIDRSLWISTSAENYAKELATQPTTRNSRSQTLPVETSSECRETSFGNKEIQPGSKKGSIDERLNKLNDEFQEQSDICYEKIVPYEKSPEECLGYEKTSIFNQDFALLEMITNPLYKNENKVWRVLRKSDRFFYAIKITFFEKDDMSWKRELENVMKLEHKNIIKHHLFWTEYHSDYIAQKQRDASHYEGTVEKSQFCELFVQMELGRKGNLQSFLVNDKERDKGTCIFILNEILTGLTYLHEKEIIHRDLKPSNVLFGQDGVIKIGDFNCSKRFENSHTRNVGTFIYQAPEVRTMRHYDSKVDIYALGVILMETIILGPNEDNKDQIIMTFVENGEQYHMMKYFSENTELLADIPNMENTDDLLEVAIKMIQRLPGNRPSCADVSEQIEQLTTNQISNTEWIARLSKVCPPW